MLSALLTKPGRSRSVRARPVLGEVVRLADAQGLTSREQSYAPKAHLGSTLNFNSCGLNDVPIAELSFGPHL